MVQHSQQLVFGEGVIAIGVEQLHVHGILEQVITPCQSATPGTSLSFLNTTPCALTLGHNRISTDSLGTQSKELQKP